MVSIILDNIAIMHLTIPDRLRDGEEVADVTT